MKLVKFKYHLHYFGFGEIMNPNEIKLFTINQQVFDGLLESAYQLTNKDIPVMGENPKLVNMYSLSKQFESYVNDKCSKSLSNNLVDLADDLFAEIGEFNFQTLVLRPYKRVEENDYISSGYKQLSANAGVADGRSLSLILGAGDTTCMVLLNNDDHSKIQKNYVDSLIGSLNNLGRSSFVLVKGDRDYKQNLGIHNSKVMSNREI